MDSDTVVGSTINFSKVSDKIDCFWLFSHEKYKEKNTRLRDKKEDLLLHADDKSE